jgi:4-aminobutyrate aminotransferase
MRLRRRHAEIGEVRGLGLMVACDIVDPNDATHLVPTRRDELVQAAFRRGLLLLGCGEAAIRFCPPLCITAEQLDTALDLLDGVLVGRHSETLAV